VHVFKDQEESRPFSVNAGKNFNRVDRRKGFFAVALSGGKPCPLLPKHAETPADLLWERTHLFLVDERFVPPDDPDSNFRLLNKPCSTTDRFLLRMFIRRGGDTAPRRLRKDMSVS